MDRSMIDIVLSRCKLLLHLPLLLLPMLIVIRIATMIISALLEYDLFPIRKMAAKAQFIFRSVLATAHSQHHLFR